MKPIKLSPLHSSVFALALTAVAILLTVLLLPLLQPDIFILFIAAVWFSAWFYGRTGGITATGASALAILFFFLRPDTSAPTPSWNVLIRISGFVLLASLITWITA